MLLEAIIIAIIASFYIGFENGKFSATKTLTYYGVMTVVSTVIVYGFLYLFTPSFTGILGGYFSAAFLPIILVSAILLFAGASDMVSGSIQILKIVCVFWEL